MYAHGSWLARQPQAQLYLMWMHAHGSKLGWHLIVNFMVNWGIHETYPNGHNISEVDWGDHDSSSNHMTEFLLSEVAWGAHDSSFFIFLINIEYDAKTMEFFTQGL